MTTSLDETKEATTLAVTAWQACRELSSKPDFNKMDYDEKRVQMNIKGFGNFINRFPVVYNAMILNNEFNARAFIKYFKKMLKFPPKSKEEWASREADYMKYLFMEYNPRCDIKLAQEVFRDTRDNLLKEFDATQAAWSEAAEKVEQKKKEVSDSLKSDILNLLAKNPDLFKIVDDFKKTC